ncbi:hypothetical protein [uncultured Draconibacterium sp.]|uniref:hypothetical protein n=1 Tax=uncultured Draconibacterium sp. TaxID=1573823 RepID=UPI0025FCC12E|nr:hypothetical protein [uncultured Draconibacterium sp.]
MMRKFKFSSYSEKEYRVFKEYPPMKRQHNFHTEEHFVVPWELSHEDEKFSAKARAWE